MWFDSVRHTLTMLLPSFVLRAFNRSTSLRLLTTPAYQNLTNPTSTLTRYFNFTPSFLAHTPAKYTHHDLLLFPDFLSQPEHDFLVSACDRKLKRSLGSAAQYEQGHFDGVIRGYRECEASHWGKDDVRVREILQRIFGLLPEEWEWLNPHILGKAPSCRAMMRILSLSRSRDASPLTYFLLHLL